MLPHLAHRIPPWFTFVLHMRSRDDMFRIGASSFLRDYSSDDDEFERKIKTLPPTIVGEVLFGFSGVRGELIAITRTPDQMIGRDALKAVRDAVKLAVDRGSRVIGLGALTSPVTNGGQLMLDHIGRGTVLTNGNAYTAAILRHNVEEAAEYLQLGTSARVAVVGCTGSVGCAASYLLAEAGFSLILVGRRCDHVHGVLPELASAFEVSDTLADVRKADVVVLLASNVELLPAHVRPGGVAIDCCHPASVPRSRYPDFFGQGSAICEGGFVRIPTYRSTYDMGTPTLHDTFACLAETYLFARQGIREHSVGRPSIDAAKNMERVAQRHGVEVRSIRNDLRAGNARCANATETTR